MSRRTQRSRQVFTAIAQLLDQGDRDQGIAGEVRRRVISDLRRRSGHRIKPTAATPLLRREAAPHLAALAEELGSITHTTVSRTALVQVIKELRLHARLAMTLCNGGNCAWTFGTHPSNGTNRED